MSADLEQLLKAHIAAAAAWREWMAEESATQRHGPPTLHDAWIEAEERLAALLGPAR